MKTGWKDMYFNKPRKPFAAIGRDSVVAQHEKQSARATEREAHRKANANIGSDAEIAAYLARVPKPYHYVEGEVSDE